MGLMIHEFDAAPLSTLISLAQADASDDSHAMNAIVTRYEPLTMKTAGVLTARNRNCFDDVANACRLGLVRAVRRHDLRRTGFTSYAARFMRGAALVELRLWSSSGTAELVADGLEATDNVEGVVIEDVAQWGDGAVAGVMTTLSRAQQDLALRRYRDDAPLAAIAAESGTSVPAVCQRLRTIHRRVERALAA